MFIMEQVCKTPTFHQFNQVYSPLYLTIIAIDETAHFFPIWDLKALDTRAVLQKKNLKRSRG